VEEKQKMLSTLTIFLSIPVPIAVKNTVPNAPMVMTVQAAAHPHIQITIKFIHDNNFFDMLKIIYLTMLIT